MDVPTWFPMWVSELHCRDEIRAKLIREHDLTFEAVREALVGQRGLRFRASEVNGDQRHELFVDVAGKRRFIVIAPHNHLIDEYWLVTAYARA
jgi:hypothetical protein